jgi:LysM repeat protein
VTENAGTARVRAARPPRLSPRTTPSGSRRRSVQVTRALGLPLLLAGVVTAAAPGFATVQRGDTLSHIAKRHGISIAELQRINELGNSTRIYAGQELRVSGSGGGSSSGGGNRHRIARGDTLSGIAARYGLSQRALAAANDLAPTSTIYAGSTLVIPGGSGSSGSGSSSSGSGGSGSASPSRPSSGSVSRAEVQQIIRDTARRYGVDASLALAIADQESGFQQGAVSSANAIGVMQVLPTTVDWMESVVGHDLNPYDVRDNVEAGVALLKVLRSQVGVEDTIAAYYQGLRAVREDGWYRETEIYVANVLALRDRRYR